ncbi:MAG: membrane protein insertion efficiency factor YidD [Patescibacteria group bacterium]
MKQVVLFIIWLYQKLDFLKKPFLRIFIGTDKTCRFTPTCSVYTYSSVKKFGAVKGLSMGLKQFSKCHPWN